MWAVGLIAAGVAVGLLLGVGAVDGAAKFAAVDFGVFANDGLDAGGIVEPALEMAGAEFAFGVFFVAGALLGFAGFELGLRGCFFRCGGRGWRRGLSGNRGFVGQVGSPLGVF